MRRNNTIDLMRLVCAVFILFIHVPLCGNDSALIIQIGRFAVPFFLLVSGYYVTPESANKQLKSVLKLTGVTLVLYSVLNSVCSALGGYGAFAWFTNAVSLKTLLLFVLFNRAVFFANTVYYLFMLIYLYIIYGLAAHWGWQRKIQRMILPLLALGLILVWLNLPWFYTGNWLLTGIPFFFGGQWLRQVPDIGKKSVWLIVGGVCLCALEWLMSGRLEHYLTIGSTMLSGGLFLFCLQHPMLAGDNIAKMCRQCSQIVFIVHCGVRDILKLFLDPDRWDFPLVVLASSVLFAFIWTEFIRIVKKHKQIHFKNKKAGAAQF